MADTGLGGPGAVGAHDATAGPEDLDEAVVTTPRVSLAAAVTAVLAHVDGQAVAAGAAPAGAAPAGAPHGGLRVVAVDGRSGSGKSTLAAAVHERLAARGTDVHLVSMEALYRGWDGLDAGAALLGRAVLAPLGAGRAGGYDAWDWATSRPGAAVTVPLTQVLVVDGVGSGARSGAGALSTLVWVSAPTPVRRARALARDGGTYAPHWDGWAAAERLHLTRERTWQRADLLVELA